MSIYSRQNPPSGFYIYAYLRDDGTPYYIGKGFGTRVWSNRRSIRRPNNNKYIVIMECNLTEVGALALERRYIRWYGRKDNNTGILRNGTDGGDGVSGIISWNKDKKMSLESRVKMSRSKKGKDTWNKGLSSCFSTETIRAMSEKRKGVPKDEEWNKKHSESLKRLPKITCPICSKTMDSSHYKRFGHGYDCKSLLSTTQLVKGLS
jgi:hypothetical protein